ncbi:hypothetical protein NC652_023792 [Populus alba x Populus x berolinensis]|nr:hypothetical protein NC652_023792 [Populus alba x Populus x berolinensis]
MYFCFLVKINTRPTLYVREGDSSSECHQQCENTTFRFFGMIDGQENGETMMLIRLKTRKQTGIVT